MFKKKLRTIYFLISFFLLFGVAFSFTYAAGDSITVHQTVNGTSTGTTTPTSTPPGGGGGGGGSHGPAIKFSNISVVAQTVTATISWNTNVNTESKVYWGTTREYKDGSLSDVSYSLDHTVLLNSLSANTLYFYKISAHAEDGSVSNEYGYFITAPPVTPLETPNVSNLQISGDASGLVIAWDNPIDPNFASVLVRRSLSGFPRSVTDGEEVYEGSGTFTYDTDVEAGNRYYYTVFAKSKSGIYSSGAVISYYIEKPFEQGGSQGSPPEGNIGGNTSTSTSSQGGQYLQLSDFIFTQKGETITAEDRTVSLLPGYPFVVLVADDTLLGKDIKSIYFERANEENNSKSDYLFNKRNDSDVEGVLLPAYFDAGKYPFKIIVENEEGGSYALSGDIILTSSATSTEGATTTSSLWAGFSQVFLHNLILIIIALFLFIFAIFFFLLWKRKKEEDEEENEV